MALPRLSPCVCAVACFSAVAALAAPRTMSVGVGDCSAPELVTGANSFHAVLREKLKGDLLDPESVLNVVRPIPPRSLQELERQVESARNLYYSGQTEHALELMRLASVDLERVSPLAKPWALAAETLVFRGSMLRTDSAGGEYAELWRKVLRVDPKYVLDPAVYSSATQLAFEAVRREVARARKFPVQFSSTPAGAEVFLDGKSIGVTPLKAQLAASTYRVVLTSGALVSFSHQLNTQKDDWLGVDMAFEGGVSLQAPLCVSAGDEKAQVKAALKLAAAVGAEQAALFRVTSGAGEPVVYSGALYEVTSGSETRSGTVRKSPTPERALSDLGSFLLTGTLAGEVKTAAGPEKAPVTPEPVVRKDETVPTAVVPASRPPVSEPAAQPKRGMGPRYVATALLAVGGALAVSGGVVALAGMDDRNKLSALLQDGKLPVNDSPDYATATALLGKIDGNQNVALALGGAGVGMALSGLLTWVLFPPDAPVGAQVTVSPAGGTVGLSGQF